MLSLMIHGNSPLPYSTVGVRHLGGVSLVRAFMRNTGTGRPKGDPQVAETTSG